MKRATTRRAIDGLLGKINQLRWLLLGLIALTAANFAKQFV